MIGYLGPEGSYTHHALNVFQEKTRNTLELLSFNTITDVIDAVSSGKIKQCIAPIENSIEGSVGETLDQLIQTSQKVTINYEIVIPIEHCLISKNTKLNKIKKVAAHKQAFRQCHSYLKKFLPDVELEETTSNSIAVKNISKSSDNHTAAIASETAALFYKVPLLEKGINDEKENFTRFVVIGTSDTTATKKDKTTIAFGVPYDKPGTLVTVLQAFANSRINLSRIESRPSRKTLGEYIFYIDLDTHKESKEFKTALSEVASDFSFYRWLGSYPAWGKD